MLQTQVPFRHEKTTQIDCPHDFFEYWIFEFYRPVGWQTMWRWVVIGSKSNNFWWLIFGWCNPPWLVSTDRYLTACSPATIVFFGSFSDVFCWFQPWNYWKRWKINKKGEKRLKKSVLTSFRVPAAPESWSKYTSNYLKTVLTGLVLDHLSYSKCY